MTNQNFPVANLNEDQLQKVKKLEQELSQEASDNIVLIAYDEKN
ncbi:hypothetical protein M670_03014 [Schinkia azotoformans MEV2011]|uniref:Uncharacterized protein n=1 Tax=Schinkia azotoformans MEV2011 TaxID=1348973 RepID=A0A072NKC5_SCHAZ|nr:hypothetical protein [Schinkia azotoformans]KEF37712.1 hypothetical protein M670_03014 [Schinkia azotoformans MEV2011]MEC1638396.1 hypothetical protein [Schinkia azotoformans]MEC1717162.1 hypothetical protein [Schinkia azotoformans]MEC1721253.1 hypothetical protein [Schinkia azotoformans]MEC1741976.1 hypothetical protein [Schinkia azotoformans]